MKNHVHEIIITPLLLYSRSYGRFVSSSIVSQVIHLLWIFGSLCLVNSLILNFKYILNFYFNFM